MAKKSKTTTDGKWWKEHLRQFAHCYACGENLRQAFVKEEGRRRHVCRGCGRITYMNPKVVAAVIPVTADGRVVLLRRNIEPAKGKWTYPAGFQEMGESSLRAAIRETNEEICVRVKVDGLLGVYSYAHAGVVTIVYTARLLKGERPSIGEEAKEVGVFTPAQIPWHDLAFKSTLEALRDWKNGKRIQ